MHCAKSPAGAHVADPMLEGYGVFTQGKTSVFNFVEAGGVDYQTVSSGQEASPAGDHTRTVLSEQFSVHFQQCQLPPTGPPFPFKR